MATSISYDLKAVTTDDGLAYLDLAPADCGKSGPVVIMLHGLRSQKENVLKTCYFFAAAGFRTISLDLNMHGERAGNSERDGLLASAYAMTLLEIIQRSVVDIKRLLDVLGVEKAAVHGLSLGGIVAFAALVDEPRLTVASVALGSPDWCGMNEQIGPTVDAATMQAIARISPLTRAAEIAPRPILMLNGNLDEVVPIAGVRALYETLAPVYAASNCPEKLDLTVYEGLGHVYNDDMVRRSIEWTRRYM